LWLKGFEGVKKLQDVTAEHCARFRSLGMQAFSKTSARSYYPYVGQYIQYLCDKGLLPSNPMIDVKNVPKPSQKVLDQFRIYQLTRVGKGQITGRQRVKTAPKQLGDFAELDFNNLNYESRRAIARFVVFVGERKKPGRLATENSYLSSMRPGTGMMAPGPFETEGLIKFGILYMNDSMCKFTGSFADRYSTLKDWALDFMQRHEDNIRAYHPGNDYCAPLRPRNHNFIAMPTAAKA
jgi:hypothetical protein